MPSPSGEQIEIAFEDQRAIVVEVGGGLRTYSVAGSDIIDGYAPDEMCTSGRGQLLLPWPNRIEDGNYEFEGRRHQLPLTEPEHHNAIHGLVRWDTWMIAERAQNSVVLRHRLLPQPGYPFTLAVAIEYGLSEAGLRVITTATNQGRERCPFGAGAHPYLAVTGLRVDGCRLRLPGTVVLDADERGIPTGSRPVTGTEHDFHESCPIGALRLDHCFTGLERDSDGLTRVSLDDPASGRRTTLWVDKAYPYLMVFTGDPLPNVNRHSLAIEPMSCAPNAFRSGDGLIVLQPRQSWSGAWGISAEVGGRAPLRKR